MVGSSAYSPSRFIPAYACIADSSSKPMHFNARTKIPTPPKNSLGNIGRTVNNQCLAVFLLLCASGGLKNHKHESLHFTNTTCEQLQNSRFVNPLHGLNLCSISMAASNELKSTIKIHGRVGIKLASDQPEDETSKLTPWLEKLKEEAVQRGVNPDTVVEALREVEPSQKIIDLDQNQPEYKLTAEAYLKRLVDGYRISRGVNSFLENKELLGDVSLHYGVPSSILTSIWGIESSYGSFTGSWNVIQALLTLSYASSTPGRAAFFREELFHALFILDQRPSEASTLKGSWAGAMGQCQFMPSSYRSFAVDYDKDGHIDIWTSKADVLASMANYLVQHGWKTGGHFAQKVRVPEDIDTSLCGLSVKKEVREWINEHGVVPEGDLHLPEDEMASLVAPDGPSGLAYLACENFRVVMRYNTSSLYCVAVYELAREIDSRVAAPQE